MRWSIPGLGVEAVRRAPPQSRGLAMGAYTVFLDVALGFGSPALGLLAGWKGLGSVFLASAIVVLGAAGVAAWLLHVSSRKSAHKPEKSIGDRHEVYRDDIGLAVPARV